MTENKKTSAAGAAAAPALGVQVACSQAARAGDGVCRWGTKLAGANELESQPIGYYWI